MKFSTRSLTAAALFWLLTEKGCQIVTVERGLSWGNPDALGVLPDRRLVEVEVKTSMTDFRRNAHKRAIWAMQQGTDAPGLPSIYYFLVPPEMEERVKKELPAYAGLLVPENCVWSNDARVLRVSVPSPRMPRRRITTKQAVRLAKDQARAFVAEYLLNTISQLDPSAMTV